MPASSGPVAHAARVAAAHARATGRLGEVVCWVTTCPEYGAVHLRRDPAAAWQRHYLERHYTPPPPTPRKVPPRD